MAIVEFVGGRITHRYLMHKRKSDLETMVGDYARHAGVAKPETTGLDKRALSHLILSLLEKAEEKERNVRLAMQGE